MPGSCFGFAPFACRVASLHARKRPRTLVAESIISANYNRVGEVCSPCEERQYTAVKKQGASKFLYSTYLLFLAYTSPYSAHFGVLFSSPLNCAN